MGLQKFNYVCMVYLMTTDSIQIGMRERLINSKLEKKSNEDYVA